MNKMLTLCAIALLPSLVHAQNDGLNVLFLGNSYIFTNDLPGVLDQLSNSLGQPFSYQSNTQAGFTLQDHVNDATTQSLLGQGGWDHVIIQAQSQAPALSIGQVTNEVFPYAEALVSSTRNADPCVMPVFMMTWGRENGDAANCPDWPPVCTYGGQQDLLTERYKQMAQDNECWTAPIGEAWRFVREDTDDFINLYAFDGSHPSPEGTYLSACVFYALLFQESAVGADYYGGIDVADAQYLQAVAAQTVLENPDDWNYHPLVSANLEFTGFAPSFTAILDLSAACDSALITDEVSSSIWLDGDASGYFFSEGTHYWSMELYSQCGDAFALDSLVVTPQFVEETTDFAGKLFPNPAKDEFYLSDLEIGSSFYVVDSQGREIFKSTVQSNRQRVHCSSWPDGVYWVVFPETRKSIQIVISH